MSDKVDKLADDLAALTYKVGYGKGRVVTPNQLRALARAAAKTALEEAADDVLRVMNDPARRRPQNGKFSTDLANDTEWAAMIVRARAAAYTTEES